MGGGGEVSDILPNEVLKVPEIAKFLRIANTTAYKMVRTGEIPAFWLGKAPRIKRSAFMEWYAKQGA